MMRPGRGRGLASLREGMSAGDGAHGQRGRHSRETAPHFGTTWTSTEPDEPPDGATTMRGA